MLFIYAHSSTADEIGQSSFPFIFLAANTLFCVVVTYFMLDDLGARHAAFLVTFRDRNLGTRHEPISSQLQ